MTTQDKAIPLSWVKKVEEALLQLEEKPQFGGFPPFPLAKLEESLQKILQKPVKIRAEVKGWTEKKDLQKGLSEPVETLAIVFEPLQSPIFWVMPKADVDGWMASLFAGNSESAALMEKSLGVGFYRYLAAVTLRAIDETKFAEPLVPRLTQFEGSIADSLDESCYLVEVTLELEGRHSRGRVLIPADFRDAWKIHAGRQPASPPSLEAMHGIPVTLSLEAGNVALPLSTWKRAKTGDFLALDEWSYDPETRKGRLHLTFMNQTLFRGKIQGDGLKILEYPLYEREGDQVDEEDEFDEDNLYGDIPEKSEGEKENDEELKLDEELELDEEVDEKPLTASYEAGAPSISPEEIQVQIRVEVARLKMTAKDMMELTPGAIIALDVSPEQGVDLIVQGKKIGRGELIKIGDRLGVRLLER